MPRSIAGRRLAAASRDPQARSLRSREGIHSKACEETWRSGNGSPCRSAPSSRANSGAVRLFRQARQWKLSRTMLESHRCVAEFRGTGRRQSDSAPPTQLEEGPRLGDVPPLRSSGANAAGMRGQGIAARAPLRTTRSIPALKKICKGTAFLEGDDRCEYSRWDASGWPPARSVPRTIRQPQSFASRCHFSSPCFRAASRAGKFPPELACGGALGAGAYTKALGQVESCIAPRLACVPSAVGPTRHLAGRASFCIAFQAFGSLVRYTRASERHASRRPGCRIDSCLGMARSRNLRSSPNFDPRRLKLPMLIRIPLDFPQTL